MYAFIVWNLKLKQQNSLKTRIYGQLTFYDDETGASWEREWNRENELKCQLTSKEMRAEVSASLSVNAVEM